MNFFRKASATGPGLHQTTLGMPIWTDRNYAKLSDEAYVRNVIGFACVQKIATAVARLPQEIFETEAKEVKVEDHPVKDLLRRPNNTQSRKELIEEFTSFFKLSGNSYLEAVIIKKDEVQELHVLRPDRMTAQVDAKGEIVRWIYKVGNFTVVYEQDNLSFKQDPIMHLRTFHPTRDIYGLSPVEPAAYSIDIHNQSDQFNKSLLDNSAVPSGLFTWKGQSDDGKTTGAGEDRFKTFAQKVKEKFSGVWGTGEPLVTGGDWEYQQLGLSIEDMALVETKQTTARETALAWNVPPQLLGIPGDNTYSNYQEANRAFYRDTVLPTADMVFEKISLFLSPTYGEFYLSYDKDQIEALAIERSLLWDQTDKAGFITINEKREKVGLEAVDGGDVLLVPSGLIPLEDVSLSEVVAGGPEPEDDDNKTGKLFSIKGK